MTSGAQTGFDIAHANGDAFGSGETPMFSPILQPIVVLVLWSMVMWLWLYVTRIPAMQKARVRLDPTIPPAQLVGVLPPRVRWKADNYNHLMEQPTLFYALCLTLAVAGLGDGLNATLAWVYVGLRVLHSLIQATVNVVRWRFLTFAAASIVLIVLAVRAGLALLLGPALLG